MTSVAEAEPTRDLRTRVPRTKPRAPLARSRNAHALEEQALFERLLSRGDVAARDALFERFQPLARSLAMRYQRSGEPQDDLVQVASMGLLKAIDRFDPGRGVAFSSYAVPTILGEVKRHFRDRTWAVRVPRDLQELALRVERALGQLADERHRQPSVAELAAAVGASDEEVLEALQARGAYRAVSIEMPRGDGDEEAATIADTLGFDEDGYDRAEERATLEPLFAAISEREREVLRMRFEEDMTQAEIAAVIGTSQMQVSRIIRAVLERLRLAGMTPSGT